MKPLQAFLVGAIVAAAISGVVAMKRSQPPKPAEAPVAVEAVSPTPASVPVAAPVEDQARPAPMPPAKPLKRKNAPVAVAENREPAPEPSQASPPASAPPQSPTPAAQPEPPVEQAPAAPAEVPQAKPPAPRLPHMVSIPSGALLAIRLGESLSSEENDAGDTFTATLAEPLVIDNFVVAERGSKVQGRVVEAMPAGRTKGLAHISVELTKVRTSDGQQLDIRTEPFKKTGPSSKTEDAAKIGAGAAIGAAIGAIAGGGKGAAIGAAVGGAAGGGTVLATRGKPAILPNETRLTFRLSAPVSVTEKL